MLVMQSVSEKNITNPKDIVRTGYDQVSQAYREDKPDEMSEAYLQYKSWVDELSKVIKPKSAVLDLGCGCGVPITRLLAQAHCVTGVDISSVQIERAKQLVPTARFICADMCELEFSNEIFNAVICLYSIIHVPISDQPVLIKKIWQWLKPEGYLLISVGQDEWTGQEKNWQDVKDADMYWSHADRDTYVRWLTEEGFVIEWERFIPEGNGGHPLMLTRKLVNKDMRPDGNSPALHDHW